MLERSGGEARSARMPDMDAPVDLLRDEQPHNSVDLRAISASDVTRERAPHVAVLIPCRNEETTIAAVVEDFRRALPDADIYVYDNASTDATATEAMAAGASVRAVPIKGKGQVVRRMFADVDADVFIISDGDGTYDASAAPVLVKQLLANHLDMVVGRRVEVAEHGSAYRKGHRLGNRLLTRLVGWLFGMRISDMLSGFRALSRRYVKSFPATAAGFEVETEMTIHALDLRLPFCEIDTAYRERPPASHSKLRTVPDALRILRFSFALARDYRPIRFFGTLAAVCLGLAAIVARASSGGGVALALVGALFAVTGCIVESLTRTRREMKRMLYLGVVAGDSVP
jgi:hypothetical protein